MTTTTPPPDAPSPERVPLRERWFDDYAAGEVFEFGDRLVTEDEIVSFALHLRVTVLDARRSAGKPGRGTVTLREEALDQRREVVMTLLGRGLYRCRG